MEQLPKKDEGNRRVKNRTMMDPQLFVHVCGLISHGCWMQYYVPFLKCLIYKAGLNTSAENPATVYSQLLVQDEIQCTGDI